MTATPIPTHNVGEIQSYIAAASPPSVSAWLAAYVQPDYLPGPLVTRAVRRLTRARRARSAVWKWLQPSPELGLGELDELQSSTGFLNLTRHVFVSNLKHDTLFTTRRHPLLSLWGLRRAALLDFELERVSPLSPELADVATALRRALVERALSHRLGDRAASGRLMNAALGAAALAVGQVFAQDSATRLTANLMIWHAEGDVLPVCNDDVCRSNRQKADDLWAGVNHTGRLAILAESAGSAHRGFWVPIAASDDGTFLPGACRAYALGSGHAVFRDDLPPLHGFDRISNKWRDYMERTFSSDLFVSLPFHSPSASETWAAHSAVLNVNAAASDMTAWRRAYHPQWLELARQAALQFVEVALWTHHLDVLAAYGAGAYTSSGPSVSSPDLV
jgi:hypothetical protein